MLGSMHDAHDQHHQGASRCAGRRTPAARSRSGSRRGSGRPAGWRLRPPTTAPCEPIWCSNVTMVLASGSAIVVDHVRCASSVMTGLPSCLQEAAGLVEEPVAHPAEHDHQHQERANRQIAIGLSISHLDVDDLLDEEIAQNLGHDGAADHPSCRRDPRPCPAGSRAPPPAGRAWWRSAAASGWWR